MSARAWMDSRPCLGVIHVPPLPGSPRAALGFDALIDRCLEDGEAWVRSGAAQGLLIENFGDAPFAAGRLETHVPAFLAIVARELRRRHQIPVGVNCLRNDALSALGAAAAAGADFIRVNVLIGVMATDQGLIQGCAHDLLRYRRSLASPVAVVADVEVKHATPVYAPPLAEAALAMVGRGLADGIIVTGSATGSPPAVAALEEVSKALAGRAPVFIGSGVTPSNLPVLGIHADGLIVGSTAKVDGIAGNPVDPGRASALRAAVATWRASRGGGP